MISIFLTGSDNSTPTGLTTIINITATPCSTNQTLLDCHLALPQAKLTYTNIYHNFKQALSMFEH